MLVVMVRIPVASDEEGEGLANRFKNRAGLVDSQPGFIGFELLKGKGEYISVTRWADQGSLDAWMMSQAHGQAHSRVPAGTSVGGGDASQSSHSERGGGSGGGGGASSGGGNVTIYEVVIPAD